MDKAFFDIYGCPLYKGDFVLYNQDSVLSVTEIDFNCSNLFGVQLGDASLQMFNQQQVNEFELRKHPFSILKEWMQKLTSEFQGHKFMSSIFIKLKLDEQLPARARSWLKKIITKVYLATVEPKYRESNVFTKYCESGILFNLSNILLSNDLYTIEDDLKWRFEGEVSRYEDDIVYIKGRVN